MLDQLGPNSPPQEVYEIVLAWLLRTNATKRRAPATEIAAAPGIAGGDVLGVLIASSSVASTAEFVTREGEELDDVLISGGKRNKWTFDNKWSTPP